MHESDSLSYVLPSGRDRRFVRKTVMAARDSTTVDEWLDSFMDLDAYLAKGGSLLDLPVNALDAVPPAMARSLVKRMGRERLDHLVRADAPRENSAQGANATGETPAEPQATATRDETQPELH